SSISCMVSGSAARRRLHSFPPRRSSDLDAPLGHGVGEVTAVAREGGEAGARRSEQGAEAGLVGELEAGADADVGQRHFREERSRSGEHTSELQSRDKRVCRPLLAKKK